MAKFKNNPIIQIKDLEGISYNIQTVGDAHLGRRFLNGTPSSKVGVRESLVLSDLDFLMNPSEDLDISHVVLVGDLFDKFIVKPTVVDQALTIIESAITANPKIKYFIIPGNHDVSKDSSKISSYYLLYKILSQSYYPSENLEVLYDTSELYKISKSLYFYLDAYNPFYIEGSNERLEYNLKTHIQDSEGSLLVSFGHWDNPKSGFGSYFPNEFITQYSNTIVSGHIHTPEMFSKNKVKYIYTGSLQPYSHSEDPLGLYYKTIDYKTIEKLLATKSKTLEDFEYKNIRINCYPGYVLSESFNCLALTYNNVLEIPKQISEDVFTEDLEVDASKITDFTSLYLYKLKFEYEIADETLEKINSFLKDSSEDVSFSFD